MAIHLESFLEKHPASKYLFTSDVAREAPDRLKHTFSEQLRKVVWQQSEFKLLSDGTPEGAVGIGTHSGRKCPAEYASNCGRSPNEVEIRGRWKGQTGGRVVFRYITIQQLFEDAQTAATICLGGPAKYALKDCVTGITDDWLFQHVIPNIRQRYPNDLRLCRVLSLSLLYICLSCNEVVYIPPTLRDRVRSACTALGLNEQHPIVKVPLHVYRNKEVLEIDSLVNDQPGEGGRPVATAGGNMTNDTAQTILIHLN